MKIEFSDKSYIEIRKSKSPDKIFIIIQAKDSNDSFKNITNAVEISIEEFNTLISDI